jgi:hypothetical protein
LGLTESVAELGVEGGGSRDEDEWEGVEDRGMSFERERAIGMLTCHEKMISEPVMNQSVVLVLVPDDDTINRPQKRWTSCENDHVGATQD